MKFVNRVLAAVLSIALVAAGLLLVVEVVAYLLGLDPVLVQWPAAYDWASRTTWDDVALRLGFLCLALVGLVLLVAELKRSKVNRLPVGGAAEGVDIAYTRRGVANAVTSAVGAVDGVRGVSAQVGRRKIRVTAGSAAANPQAAEGLTGAVTQVTQRRIQEMGLDPAPRVVVAVARRRG